MGLSPITIGFHQFKWTPITIGLVTIIKPHDINKTGLVIIICITTIMLSYLLSHGYTSHLKHCLI
jgi:hypothetical protein